MTPKKQKILISGARGGIASELSRHLCGDFSLIGIDPRRPIKENQFFGEIHPTNYRSRKVDDLFRQNKFKAFFHLGRVSVTSGIKTEDRFSENVLGTQHLLDLCEQHKVPLVVVLSTYHVYGAHPHTHLYIKESDPLRATQTIFQLADALELDHLATQFSLSFPGTTVVLRPTNIVGPKVWNSITKLLRLDKVPHPLGFDPLFQVLHQDDLIRALLTILKNPKRGIFNLAASGVLPLSEILRICSVESFAVPESLLRLFLKIVPLENFKIPDYMVDFFKFPCILDTEKFKSIYKFEYEKDLITTLKEIN